MPLFVVTNRIPDSALDLLRGEGELRAAEAGTALPREELLALVAGADAIVSMLYDRVDGTFFDAAGPQLRCVANVAVGFDNIDLTAATQRGILLANTPGVLDDATADLAMALVLASRRRLGEGERLVRSGRPWNWGMSFMLGGDLRGKRLGIVGLGNIGARVAERARAFGMSIAYHGRHAAPAERVVALEAERLGLDEQEPLVEPGLLGLENVVLSPHVGSATVETRTAMAELAARNAIAALRGEKLLTPISLPAP